MKQLLQRTGWVLFGIGSALVALELLFRLLPVSMGLQRASDTARWPLIYAQPRSHYAYSISWTMLNAHRGTTNNYGHIAPRDFVPGSRPVVVLGDSFIESLMNDHEDTLQAQLGVLFGDPAGVYGLGVSGLSASGYVALGALARAEFAPRAAVVAIIDGDLSESLQRTRGSHYLVEGDSDGGLRLEFEPPGPEAWTTRVRKSVGDSALFRYLQANLQFTPSNVLQVLQPGKPGTSARPSSRSVLAQRRVVDWMLDELPRNLGLEPRCIALLLDADRYGIYKKESASEPKDSAEARRYLIDQAGARGFAVSDLGPLFRHRHARDHIKFDHWPFDRHWNRAGHGLAAEEAFRLLTSPVSGAPACLLPAGKVAP